MLLRAPIAPEAEAPACEVRVRCASKADGRFSRPGRSPIASRSSPAANARVVDMPPSSQQTFELAMPHGVPYKSDPRFPTNYVYICSIARRPASCRCSRTARDDSRFLGVIVRLIPTYGDAPVVATIAVVTSSPPFAEGGHLVMARELVRALREEGHDTGLVVTPQNRFGRQGSAYLAAWCTDVGSRTRRRKVDQVISLRFPGYAVQHPNHVLWLNHRMREYYDLWDQFSSHLSWKGRIKERARRAIIHRVDKHLLRRRCSGAS